MYHNLLTILFSNSIHTQHTIAVQLYTGVSYTPNINRGKWMSGMFGFLIYDYTHS